MNLQLPEILNIPKKLLPMITEFNNYRYFLNEGGRGSGKSHSVVRFICYLCSIKTIRVICAREIQNSIQESVYQLFVDVIGEFKLDFEISQTQITHKETGSTIRFKGCREQGAVSLKSMEGVDILWVEEAQSLSQVSLDIIIPTIRKEKAKVFFTMNRYVRSDPVYETLAARPECLTIHIDYFENPFCPDALRIEAEACKRDNPKDYGHIWLGQPLATTSDYLFNFDKLAKMETIMPDGEIYVNQSCLSVDFAGMGGDLCVASYIVRRSVDHWEVIRQDVWSDPDTDVSVGKTIALYGELNPTLLIVDACGLGEPMYNTISKSVPKCIAFKGSETKKCSPNVANHRADSFLALKYFIDNEWLICKSKQTIKELESIKKKYMANGRVALVSKEEMRKKGVSSPDRADSVSMGMWAIRHYMGKQTMSGQENQPIRRVSQSKRSKSRSKR